MVKARLSSCLIPFGFLLVLTCGFSGPNHQRHSTATSAISLITESRRDVLESSASALVAIIAVGAASGKPVFAFEGQGSTSYSGRTPATQAAKAKSYRDRIAADVKDFNSLGAAIDRGETSGDAWVAFFIQYQRREPDSVGRTYAAQVDLTGLEGGGGGAGLLLASTFAKPNKPPDNLPQYKKYNILAKTLEPIKNAGKAGDAAKAKKEWSKASVALSEYLEAVEMPSDLSDHLYK